MANWQIRHRTHNGDLLHTIDPENLNFTINLDDPHDISYEVSTDNPVIEEENTAEGDWLGAYQHDWELLRDGEIITGMAGMVTSINIPSGQEVVKVTGKSWLHYLERRHYPFDPHNPLTWRLRMHNEDVCDIIHEMLTATLSRDYSLNIDLLDLVARTTFDSSLRIEFGDTEDMLSKIKTLAEGKPGFDFEILENKEFRLYYPEYSDPTILAFMMITGSPETVVHTDSALETEWTDNGPEGTHLLAFGAGSSYKMGRNYGSTEGQQTFRRLDHSMDFGDQPNFDALEKLAKGALRAAVRPQREVPIKVAPENINDFWNVVRPGVYFESRTNIYGHQVTGTKKLVSIDAEITNEGEELVELHSTLWKAWYDVDGVVEQI